MNNSNLTNKAYFTVDKLSDEDKLNWLESNLQQLTIDNQGRTIIQMEHLRAYANANSVYNINEPADEYLRRIADGVQKVRVPHIHDITEVKISQMTRLKARVRLSPKHSEYDDRGTAKIAKLVIDNIFIEQDLDAKMIEMHRYKYIFGEMYAFVEWDGYAGDLDEDYKKLAEAGYTKIKPIKGKTIDISYPVRKGDLKIRLEQPWNVMFERRRSGQYKDATFMFNVTYAQRDELLFEYPDLDEKCMNYGQVDTVANAYLKTRYNAIGDEVPVFHFYHKKCKFLPGGKYIKFVCGQILEEKDLPYSHGDFPCERLTDIDMPTLPNGVSRYTFCLPIQKRIDDLNLLVDTNIKNFSNTKYLIPPNTNIDELSDESNAITVPPGGQAPSILKVEPVPVQMLERIQKLETDLERMMGNHGISRGTLPTGVTAGIAMSFLKEEENQRSNSEISKTNEFVVRLARKALSVMADNIKDDPVRMTRLVGKDNVSYIKYFTSADLNKEYDITAENSDGFPESEVARRDRIGQYMHQNPNMMTGPEWMHYIGMSDEEGIIDSVTEAIRTAESEVEDILAGRDVDLPEDYEDLVTKLRIFYKAVQKRFFKEEAPEKVKVALKQHINVAEELVIEKMKSQPLLQGQLAQLPMFPMFYHKEYQPPKTQEQVAAEVQGQANRGEPITEIIPGTPKQSIK